MERKCDVLVAGGGIAGSLVSYFLASRGFEVILLERKHKDDTMKVCGDAIGKHHFERVGIPHPSGEEVFGVFKGVKVIAPNERDEITVLGEGYALNRPLFVKRLRRMATDAGANMLDNHSALMPIIRGSWVKGIEALNLKERRREEISAKVVIDATGVASAIRRKLPPNWFVSEDVPLEDYDVCYREIVELDQEIEEGYALIYLSRTIAPGGYWWFFPKGGNVVNVGLGVKGGEKSPNPRKNFEKYLRHRIKVVRTIHAGGGICPTRRAISCMVWNGFLVIGDAACTSNPIHGGGMGPAMLSAMAAAKTIEKAISEENPTIEGLWSYQKEYMELYGEKQAGLDVLRMYLQLMSDEELNFVFEKGIITSSDVSDIGYGGSLGPSLVSKVSSAIKLLSKPSLLARLKKVKDFMEKARELYHSYPESPKEFPDWKAKVDSLFKKYRAWLES